MKYTHTNTVTLIERFGDLADRALSMVGGTPGCWVQINELASVRIGYDSCLELREAA